MVDYKTQKGIMQADALDVTIDEELRKRTILYYKYGTTSAVRGRPPEITTQDQWEAYREKVLSKDLP